MQVVATHIGGDWFFDQVTGLARLGHDVRAVVPGEGPLTAKLRAAGIPLDIIPFSGKKIRQLPRISVAEIQLMRLIRAHQPEVIHSHLIKAMLACRMATVGYRGGIVVSQVPGTVHLRSRAVRWMDQVTLRRDDVVLGSCQAIADEYVQMGARSTAVSYYGCDVHKVDPLTSASTFRREFGLADDTPAVGMVAYMYPYRLRAFREYGVKGHEVFIDAAPKVLAQVPNARLFVIGDELIGNGDYRRSLEERARQLGLGDRIVFTGYRGDVTDVMAGLDVIVNPSIEESACYTMVEALLMRKGVIASDVGGLPDTVQNGETGLLVPPGNSAELADAVVTLLGDPGLRQKMGELGRERCLRRFDIKNTVSKVEEVYLAALGAAAG